MQRKLNKAANFNRRKNSILSRWYNLTWKIDGSGRAYNTPTLGSELLTDGSFENWTNTTNATNWTEVLGGTSTVNQETTIVQSGLSSARIDIDSDNTSATIRQILSASIGSWIYVNWWFRTSDSGKTFRMSSGGSYSGPLRDPGTTWTNYNDVYRITSVGEQTLIPGVRGSSASSSGYLDNITAKVITLNSTLATINGSNNNQTVKSTIYAVTTGTQSGVIANLDSSSNPQNFIIAYHDGRNVRLEKCVAGVYTQLISTAVTFVSNAQIEIRRPSGNTFQLWYNGVQINTDQTVSDSEIINNNLYGIFSTYSGNLISEFTLGGVVIPFTF